MQLFIKITRYSARIISLSILSFIVLAGFTDLPDPLAISSNEVFMFFPFLISLFAIILAWKFEMVGGGIAIIFTFVFMSLSNVANVFTYTMLLAATLFLLSGILANAHKDEFNNPAIVGKD